jgi:hypothetical protein
VDYYSEDFEEEEIKSSPQGLIAHRGSADTVMGTQYTGPSDRLTPETSLKLLFPATETINPDDYYSSDIGEFYENLSEIYETPKLDDAPSSYA